MHPTLWGPPLWQALFACAWACPPRHVALLREVVMEHVPALLPCALCRRNYPRHLPRVRQRVPRAQTARELFEWLYWLKHEVNKRRSSITLAELTERHLLYGGAPDEVAIGDMLVLLAIAAAGPLAAEDTFIALCRALAALLPLPADSQMREHLDVVGRPIVPAAVRVAQAARVERGHPRLPRAHYESLVSE